MQEQKHRQPQARRPGEKPATKPVVKKKKKKKWLTNERRPDKIAMFRRERRAPCKLNNVTKRKHQKASSFR